MQRCRKKGDCLFPDDAWRTLNVDMRTVRCPWCAGARCRRRLQTRSIGQIGVGSRGVRIFLWRPIWWWRRLSKKRAKRRRRDAEKKKSVCVSIDDVKPHTRVRAKKRSTSHQKKDYIQTGEKIPKSKGVLPSHSRSTPIMPLVVVPAVRPSPSRSGASPSKPVRPAIIPRGIPSKPIPIAAVGSMAPRHLPSTQPLTPTALPAAVPSLKTTAAAPSIKPLSAPLQTPDGTAGAIVSLAKGPLAVGAVDKAPCHHSRPPSAIGTLTRNSGAPPPSKCNDQPDTPNLRDTAVSDGPVAARNRERAAGVAHQATLGALVVYADWSEACTLFVPKALAALQAHPDLVDGALAVHVDAESCLCAYYAVDAVPCIIFRARPRGPSWRWCGAPRPIEIPNTRITGACSDRVLTARINAAVAAFCLVVPPVGTTDAPMPTPRTRNVT